MMTLFRRADRAILVLALALALGSLACKNPTSCDYDETTHECK